MGNGNSSHAKRGQISRIEEGGEQRQRQKKRRVPCLIKKRKFGEKMIP